MKHSLVFHLALLAFCLLLVALGLLAAVAWGAEVDPEIQKLLAAAPKATDYPDEATATVLDEGSYTVSADGIVTERTHQVTKIMNERGHEYGPESVTYSSLSQEVRIITARTIKSDGTVVDVAKGDMVESDVYQGFDMYDDVKEISFPYPGIEDGCLVEVDYEIKTTKPMMPSQLDAAWFFQGYDPNLDSSLTVTVPESYATAIRPYNLKDEPQKTVANGMVTYRWAKSCPEKYDPEPYCPPYDETTPWVEIRTQRDWKDIAAWYAELTKDCAQPDDTIKAKVEELSKDAKSDEDKARAIFHWVEDNVRYVAVELGESAYKPHAAAEVFEKRYGDCKDMSNLLKCMLGVAGIKANLALLMAQSDYRPVSKQLASPGQFNHCIAHTVINGKTYWLDATAQLCPFGDIPMGDAGCDALVIDPANLGFQTLPPLVAGTPFIKSDAKVTVDAEGGVTATVNITAFADAAMSLRGAFKYAKPDQLTQIVESIAKQFGAQAKVTDSKLPDPKEWASTVTLSISFTAADWAQKTGNLIVLRPDLSQDDPGAGGNPFTKDERKLPFFFTKSPGIEGAMEITLPAGYVIDSKPETMVIDNEYAHSEVTFTVEGDSKISVSSKSYTKDARLPIEKFADIKAYFLKAAERSRDTIILKEKE